MLSSFWRRSVVHELVEEEEAPEDGTRVGEREIPEKPCRYVLLER